jgi:hypothetical protein
MKLNFDERKLTQQDKKILKYEKRMGYVFAGIILTFGILLNIIFIATNHEREGLLILVRAWSLLLLIDFVIVGLSSLTAFLMNKKINKDLSIGIKIITTEKIEWKEHKIDYEVGSGWGRREMKPYSKYILILKGIEYDVEKELFDSVEKGNFVEIHNAKYSETLLEIKKNLK